MVSVNYHVGSRSGSSSSNQYISDSNILRNIPKFTLALTSLNRTFAMSRASRATMASSMGMIGPEPNPSTSRPKSPNSTHDGTINMYSSHKLPVIPIYEYHYPPSGPHSYTHPSFHPVLMVIRIKFYSPKLHLNTTITTTTTKSHVNLTTSPPHPPLHSHSIQPTTGTD